MDATKTQVPSQENKLHFLDYWRIIRIRKTIIVTVFLLVAMTATLVSVCLPKSFSSTVKIRLEKDQTDVQGLQQQPYGVAYDPFFIQTEFELIRSETILGKVITSTNIVYDPQNKDKRNQNLNERWGSKIVPMGIPGPKLMSDQTTLLPYLRSRVFLNTVRNTSLIEITVNVSNSLEEKDPASVAATLANAIADTYKEYRRERRQSMTEEGIKALKKALEDQNQKIDTERAKVNKMREELHIPDSVANGEVAQPLLTAETLRHVENLRMEAKAELGKQQTLLDRLTNLSPAELVETLATTITDAHLTSLREQKTMVSQKLIAAEKQLGENNPELQALKSQKDDLNQQISDTTKGILLGIAARVDMARQVLAELETEVARAESNDIAKASQSAPYFEAKRVLEGKMRLATILDSRITTENTDLLIPKSTQVEIAESAVPSIRPASPNIKLNIGLGMVVGLVVGIGLAFFIEYLDTSVKTIDDVERALGSPVLGVIPQNVGLIIDEGADSPHAEAYRVLRTNLLFSRKDDKLNSVAVVSAGAGEGKSTTVFNLACIFAQGGQRVLIVDSDLRRPTLHKLLRVTNNIGLTNYLLRQNILEEVIQTTSLPTLDFMASGKLPSSSLGILSSAQMREVINELKQHYDYVFFDSPPIMGVSDASILASEVDMTIQVIQYRRYPQPMNIRAKQLIEKVGGNLVGIVLNNINMAQDESYYYYSGYYHENDSKDEEQEPAAADKAETGSKTT